MRAPTLFADVPGHVSPIFDTSWAVAHLAGVNLADRQAMRQRLLGPTLEWAVKAIPGYRGLPSALEHWPRLTRRLLSTRGEELLCPSLPTEVILMSSGTTTNRVQLLHRCLFEFRLVEEFHSFVDPPLKSAPVLQLADIAHGLRVPQLTWRGLPLVQIPVTSEPHFHLAKEFLEKGGFIALNGAAHTIQLLTWWWPDDPPPTLTELYFGGVVLSGRWRKRLRRFWQAEIRHMFGLTEFHQGHAVSCPACGGYHFGHGVVPEVLSPGNTDLAPEGSLGELVLTHLLPLAQRQPLIRYESGDLVRLLPYCDVAGDRGVLPFGRLADCPELPNGERWPALAVSGALDEHPELVRKPVRLLSGVESGDVATPRHRVDFDIRGVTVRVEVDAAQTGGGAGRHDLSGRVAETVRRACSQAWQRPVADDEVVFRVAVMRPGELEGVAPQ